MTGQAHKGVSLACAGRGYLDDALPSDDVRRARPAGAGTHSGPGALLLPAPADAGVNKAVNVAVEHRVGVAHLVAGAQVLDHLVGVEHVGAHLVAP